MRIHTLEATGGLTYSQLPRFATADGKGTNDETKALKGKNGQALDNPIRQIWITETALTTALNSSYLAENVAMFGIVVGVALLLTGIGFAILVFAGVAPRTRQGIRALRPAQAGDDGNFGPRCLTPCASPESGPRKRPALIDQRSIQMKLMLIALVALAVAGSAFAAPRSATLTIRHQLHGCHSWSFDGSSWKASQRSRWLAAPRSRSSTTTSCRTSSCS